MKRERVGNAYRRHWTKERIIDAIKLWNRRMGEAPRSTDWDIQRARKLAELHERLAATWRARIETFEFGNWPSVRTVREMFGTWNEAIAEAGFEPRAPGQNTPRGVEPSPFLLPLGHAVKAVYKAEDADDTERLVAALRQLAAVAKRLAREAEES